MSEITQQSESFLQRNGRRGLLGLLALLVVAALWMRGTSEPAIPVRTAVVSRAKIASVISTNGKVEPENNFEAHAPGSTTVRRVLVAEGARVKTGQLLMELNDADAQAQLARAVAQLKAAEAAASATHQGGTQEEIFNTRSQLIKATANRDVAAQTVASLKRLQPQGAASVGEVREAENTLNRAETEVKLLEQRKKGRYSVAELERVDAQADEARATYAAAQDALSKSVIRAPRNGIVYQVAVKQGAFVNGGDLLLQMAPLEQMQVRAFIDEPDLGKLAVGQQVDITWDALAGHPWQGTLASLPAVVKLRGTRNVGEITVRVNNQDLKLLPNVNVTVTVVTAEHDNVLVLPREALRQEDGQRFVYQIVDGRLVRHNVTTGLSNLTQYELTGGVSAAAQVALGSTNNKPLHNEAKVRVVE